MDLKSIRLNYRLLPVKYAVQFREECITNFGWSMSTFYNKMRGKYAFTPLEERSVIHLLGKYEKYNILNSENDDKA